MTIRAEMFICFAGGHRFRGTCGRRDTTTPSPIPDPEPISTEVTATNVAQEGRYSTEQLVEWATSFKSLVDSKEGRKLFRTFLKSEYSQENLLFYEACLELEELEDEDEVFEKARNIYEDYISTLSPREVSLTSWIRDDIQERMINPDRGIYIDACKHVYNLMLRDSYPRFKNSLVYRTALENSNAN